MLRALSSEHEASMGPPGKLCLVQGLNSVEDPIVKLNLRGESKTMTSKDWVDPQGRKGKGYGVYR
jgi:hypothetical protein